MIRLIPGDPAILMADEDATPEQIEALRERWGLNDPIPVQFIRFIENVFQGDFGTSIRSGKPVFEEIMPRFRNTIVLALSACFFALLGGITAGIVSSVKPYSKTDNVAIIAIAVKNSIPVESVTPIMKNNTKNCAINFLITKVAKV